MLVSKSATISRLENSVGELFVNLSATGAAGIWLIVQSQVYQATAPQALDLQRFVPASDVGLSGTIPQRGTESLAFG
jgi:hypothetical protein